MHTKAMRRKLTTKYPLRRLHGFTLVEMVVVIVLLGIVGAVLVPRFLAPNSFRQAAAQDGLIMTIRAAQQAAVGRANVTFDITTSGSDWLFRARAGGTTIQSFSVASSDVLLTTGAVTASNTTCANDYTTPLDPLFELAFDVKGNLASVTNGGAPVPVSPTFNGVRICLNASVPQSVCVSRAGYAYAGDCDG